MKHKTKRTLDCWRMNYLESFYNLPMDKTNYHISFESGIKSIAHDSESDKPYFVAIYRQTNNGTDLDKLGIAKVVRVCEREELVELTDKILDTKDFQKWLNRRARGK